MNPVPSKKEGWELGELKKGHLAFTVAIVLGTQAEFSGSGDREAGI